MKFEEVKLAYKRLKSYVYHENYSLSLLIKIAQYEDEDIDKNLRFLYKSLIQYKRGNSDAIDKLISEIDYSILPKTYDFSNDDKTDIGFIYSNVNEKDKYLIDRKTTFIDCSVNIHLISVLWIMFIGKHLDKDLGLYCFGNRLHRNSDDDFEKNSIKLFKKYFINYKDWRDNGIKKARELHKMNHDVSILNLDIKNYYDSVDFDVNSLEKKIENEYLWLNEIMSKINFFYSKKLFKNGLLQSNKKALPIGLLSSSILANYYLKDFDYSVINELKPSYYGRYVDDIIIVLANPKVRNEDILNNFILDNISTRIKSFKKELDNEHSITINKNKLFFQTKKVKLYFFQRNESINLLEKFEKEIERNSSEFRYEPESEDILDTFEDSSYKISYSDTINKFRSVDGITVDKLGVSKHLSKLISSTKVSNQIDDRVKEKLILQIKNYFSGQRGLELNSLWEKVFNFLIINNAVDEIISFTNNQIKSILKIDKSSTSELKTEESIDEIKVNLLTHLANSFAMSSSLNNSLFTDNILKRIIDLNNNSNNEILKILTLDHIQPKSKAIINSNLLRHHLISYPLLNYCKDVSINFLDKKVADLDFVLDDKKIEYSPRFIHYSELCLFYQFKEIFRYNKQVNREEFIFNEYVRCNNLKAKKYKAYYPKSIMINKEVLKVSIKSKFKGFLKIGLVNSKIELNHSLSSMKDEPVLIYKRFDEINHILNESLNRQKADIIIFPEISIPFQWLPHLTEFSRKNGVAIVCGLEHISNSKREILNYVATILPFKFQVYNNAYVDLRLKKDYSPAERKEIEGRRGLKIPLKQMSHEKLRLYEWNKLLFSVFNCFELADIRKRAIFRGKVDFVITVEYNKDIIYFSNITDTISRDLHSYIIQVNTSDYGDSRISQPSESYSKDILKIKGGDNVSLITGSINIQKLRDFQKLEYSLQELKGEFKFTPPNYKPENRD